MFKQTILSNFLASFAKPLVLCGQILPQRHKGGRKVRKMFKIENITLNTLPKFDFKLLFIIALFASNASFLGAKAVSFINTNTLKPVILVLLIVILVYTFFKKDLGSVQTKTLPRQKQIIFGSLIGLVVGFYDGFFGPGAGSFFALGFVVILGFEFITASAYSKIINCFTKITKTYHSIQ